MSPLKTNTNGVPESEEEPPSLIEKLDLLRDECGGGPVNESREPLGTA
jgi:hypothetical protein